jgi:hypothetical protein
MNDIVDSYLAIYPLAESIATRDGSFFKESLEEIKREFCEYNITGSDKAKLLISFISSAYGHISASAQKGALELSRLACTLPSDLTEREKTTENIAKEIEVKTAQLARLAAEAELLLKRAAALNEQEVSAALTGALRALSDMIAGMAQGGITPPVQITEAVTSFISATVQHINSLKPELFLN